MLYVWLLNLYDRFKFPFDSSGFSVWFASRYATWYYVGEIPLYESGRCL